MSRADVEDFLAELDDVVDDWEGSADSATWAADGSHEPTELDGEYYGYDSPGSASGRGRLPADGWAGRLYLSPRRSDLLGEWRITYQTNAVASAGTHAGGGQIDLEVPPPGSYSRYTLMIGALLLERAAHTAASRLDGLAQLTMTIYDESPMPAADMPLFYGRHLLIVHQPLEVAVEIPRQRHLPHRMTLLKRDLETAAATSVPETTATWRTLGPRLLGPTGLTIKRPDPSPPPAVPPTCGPPQARPARGLRRDQAARRNVPVR